MFREFGAFVDKAKAPFFILMSRSPSPSLGTRHIRHKEICEQDFLKNNNHITTFESYIMKKIILGFLILLISNFLFADSGEVKKEDSSKNNVISQSTTENLNPAQDSTVGNNLKTFPTKEESGVKVKVDTQIDKKKVHKGDEVTFSIIVEQSGGNAPYLFELESPELSGLELVKEYSEDTIFASGQFRRDYKLILKATEEGEGRISSAKIYYTVPNQDKKNQLIVPSENIEVLKERKSYKKEISYFIVAILAICVSYFGMSGLKKLKVLKEVKRLKEKEANKTPYDKAMEKLNSLESLQIEGNISTFYEGVEKVLKNYLYEKYDLNVLNKSGREIADLLMVKKDLLKFKSDKVKPIFERCEEVKFTGIKPIKNQQEEIKKDLINFLNDDKNKEEIK